MLLLVVLRVHILVPFIQQRQRVLKHFWAQMVRHRRVFPFALAVKELAQAPHLVEQELLAFGSREMVSVRPVGQAFIAMATLDH